MKKDRMDLNILTRREELLLLAVHNLQAEAYLVAINDYLRTKTGKKLALPSVHRPLNRLLRKGLIRAEFGEATAVRGGRRKKIYCITKDGYAALAAHQVFADRLWRNYTGLVIDENEKG